MRRAYRQPADAVRTVAAMTAAARSRAAELLAPVSHRDYRLLWSSQVISELGDWAARVAVTALVYERSKSPLLSAIAFIASLLPWLGPGQLLATLADRHGRRVVMVGCDLARAALFALLFLPLPIPVLLALVLLAGFGSPPFEAARSAAVAETVPAERLGGAVQLSHATTDAATLLGYLAGGLLLVTVGARWGCLLDAGTFLISALFVARLPHLRPGSDDADPDADAAAESAVGSLRAAAAGLWRDRLVAVTVGLATLAVATGTALESQAVAWGGRDAAGLPWLPGAVLAGATAVSLVATLAVGPGAGSRATLTRSALLVLIPSSVAGALFMFGLVAATAVGLVTVGALFAALTLANVVIAPRLVPARRAVSFALLMGLLTAAQAVLSPAAGLLVGTFGAAHAFAALCALPAVAAAGTLLLVPRCLSETPSVSTGAPIAGGGSQV